MATPWILSIDFGTSYTLVAAKVGDRNPEVVEIGGERRMPSVVLVEPSGTIVVGRTADDLSGANPANTLRAPKNRLGDQAPVVLGGRPYQVVQLVAALLRTVYDEAVGQMGEPPTEVRLTHPATWNRPRLNRLLEAAAKAGLPNPALVPEPVAAALSYASDAGVPEGGHLVVYDLGGGTFDTAVVTARRGGFEVEGRPGGDQTIGGELFDELVVNHIGERLDPEAWEQIQIADDPVWQQVGASLRKEARRAKEALSSHPYADLLVPLPDGLVQQRITRAEFEQIVGPYIDETVNLLQRCITDAGVDESRVASIYLVGGASRSPIVERLVRAAFDGVPVSRRGDPKTSVALGAARAVRSGAPGGGTPRSTQEASPNTADEPLLFGPPSGPGAAPRSSDPGASGPHSGPRPTPPPAPASDPGSGQRAARSDPGGVPPASSDPGSRPVPFPGGGDPGGRRSVPPRPPAAGPTSDPGSVPGVHGLRTGSTGSATAGAVSAPPSVQPAAGASAGAAPQRRRGLTGKTAAIILAIAVVVGAVIGIVLISTGGSDSGTTSTTDEQRNGPPSDDELADALLTRTQVAQHIAGASWTQLEGIEPTVDGDSFCDFTLSVEPSERVIAGFNSPTSNIEVYSSIDQFADDSEALRSLGQDQSIAANCSTDSEYNVGGVDYTVELFDVSDSIGDTIGTESAAVGYRLTPPADRSDLQTVTGYILEWRRGIHIVTVEFSVLGRQPSELENDQFGALVSTYYEQTGDLA